MSPSAGFLHLQAATAWRDNERRGAAPRHMSEETTAPAEQEAQIDNTETTVRDAEAVLRKNSELLAENAELKRLAKQAKDFDFEKARAAIAALEHAEEEKLAKKGEFDKLLEQKTRAWEERIAGISHERDGILTNLKREKLANVLAEKGVLPDRTRFLVRELEAQIELHSGEEGFSLRKVGGVGDATEFDAIVEKVKAEYPFFFGASLAPGSGASGSSGNGPAGSAKKWSDLTVAEKTAAIREAGGDLETAQGKYK